MKEQKIRKKACYPFFRKSVLIDNYYRLSIDRSLSPPPPSISTIFRPNLASGGSYETEKKIKKYVFFVFSKIYIDR